MHAIFQICIELRGKDKRRNLMKFLLTIRNAPKEQSEFQYICNCQPDAQGFFYVGQRLLRDENELRSKLVGVLSDQDIDSTIKTLAEWKDHTVDFPGLQLSEEQAKVIG